MIILYITIGSLLPVLVSMIFDIFLMDEYDKFYLNECETIRDFLNEINPISFIPILNIVYCIGVIFLILVVLVCKLYCITKLNVLWNKFLNIKIRRNKSTKNN
jgi:ABC-type uncharacterized transport system fused permease/ATPase subunit